MMTFVLGVAALIFFGLAVGLRMTIEQLRDRVKLLEGKLGEQVGTIAQRAEKYDGSQWVKSTSTLMSDLEAVCMAHGTGAMTKFYRSDSYGEINLDIKVKST